MANDVVRLRREAPRPEIGDVVGWDGEGWVPLAVMTRRGIIGPRGLGEWLKIGQSMEGPDIDLHMGNGTIGRGGDSVLVFDAGGEPVTEYAATNAGFAAALAAAGSGDLIQLPAAVTLSAAHTIPSGVTVRGPCLISASGAYGDLLTVVGTLEDVEIAYTATGASGYVSCVYRCASGGCELRRVWAVTTCATAAEAHGARLADVLDGARIVDCYLAAVGNYVGAVRYGLRVTTPGGSDGRNVILSNVIGYGYANSSSAVCYGIYVEGTQARTLLAGCIGYGLADWSDGTGTGIYGQNVTLTGCVGDAGYGSLQAGIEVATSRALGCRGLATPQGAGIAHGIKVGYDGYVSGCRGKGTFGMYRDPGGGASCYVRNSEAEGSTTDLYVHTGTAHVYGVQYDSEDGAGTVSQEAGDRVGLDELASNANAEGASLVGIEDAGELITATDVEGALAELAGGLDLSGLGTMLFNEADGRLLLGPDGEITPAEWWSQRKQKAALSGAFHQEAGRWQGTRGLVVEETTTNLITNPSIETATTGWIVSLGTETITRDGTYSVYGDYALKVVINVGGAHSAGTIRNVTAETAINTEYTFSAWLRGTPGENVCLWMWDAGGGNHFSGDIALTNTWTRYTFTATYGAGAVRYVGILAGAVEGDIFTFYADGIQLEALAAATSYCDGTLGTGYAWSGAVHASTSTRAATEVNLDSCASLLSNNIAWSVGLWVQMPLDHDATWPASSGFLFTLYENATNYAAVYFNPANDRIVCAYREAVAVASAGYELPFTAGDWVHIVVNYNTAGNMELFVNGVLRTTNDISARAVIQPTEMNLGAWNDASWRSNCNHAESSLFDRVLTADEVANLHALQRPLVDAGAFDLPSPMMDGLYGYEKFGGFTYWEGMVMDGGEIEVLPDAAGDAVYGVYAMCIATDRGVNTVQGTYPLDTPGAGSNATGIYLAPPDSVSLRLYSTGRLTIDEIAGVAPIYVNLWLMWQ